MQARSGPTEVVSGLVDGCGKTAAAIEYRMSSADLVSTLTARTPSIGGSHTDRRVLAPRYVEEIEVRRGNGVPGAAPRAVRPDAADRPPEHGHAHLRRPGLRAAHYAEPLTVDDLARQVALSPSAFSRLFREVTGRTPYQFLKEYRLGRARAARRPGCRSPTLTCSTRICWPSSSPDRGSLAASSPADPMAGARAGRRRYFMPRRTMSTKMTTTATITTMMIAPVPWETSRFLGRAAIMAGA
jgi:Bacterial regulatory helix-turn-helix proteins, AraC family